MGEHVSLYMSPINLDPEQPAMPISHPGYYAGYLAKRHGPFATLGLAEDTWALNEGVTDDATFLQQAHDIDDERRTMCLTALDRLRRGTLVCVFDATDRIQHMFWRYLDASHPAHRTDVPEPHKHAIRELYRKNDALVGEVQAKLQPNDVLMVLSDHGFSAFRRGVNLNAWLLREGYLALQPGRDGSAEWLRDVDWTKTRAYCVGLSGMYLNLRGREQEGVVAPGVEAAALKAEIIGKLRGLRDAERAEVGVREAFDTATLYSGPYLENAPDFIIGYNAGYRASWDGATGVVAGPVFEDNTKAWSGDHCIDPRLVPGVFFCNRKVTADGRVVDRRCGAHGAAPLRARPARAHGRPALGRGVMTARATNWRVAWFAIVALAVVAACGPRHTPTGQRVVVLGIDGLDYHLVRDLIAQGRLPNLARLGAAGRFTPLATSTPPLSPVAWSTFLTGLDPGEHGIFDFIHRHPETIESFLSTSRTVPPSRMLTLGRWQFPLAAGRVELLRHGTPFWEVLEQRGVETTIVRMPANFPPSGTATRELSGMGTPDMLGTYGIFTLFTSRPEVFERQDVSGGMILPVDVLDGVARASIEGPPNPYLVTPVPTTVAFEAHVDQAKSAVKIVIGDQAQVLRLGEWGDWLAVELPLAPMTSLPGQVRFLLKSLTPYFELYASPINLDPFSPALPISSPEDYASELARVGGRFYTQGMPEDTRGMNAGVLKADELLAQARITADENLRQFDYVLGRFTDGLLFYYFGHVDQVSHMMWRAMDPTHPAYTDADARYRHVIEDLYVQMDGVVGRTRGARWAPRTC